MKDNRFAPPATDVTEPKPPVPTDYQLAKRDQRAAGFVIDALLTYPLMLLLKILPGALGIFVLLDVNVDLFVIPNLFSWLATLFFYYLVCEGIWFRTIGKMITGTRVIHTSGRSPSFIQVLIRTLVRYVPLEFLSYLGGGNRPSGWHDRWSNTRVISD
jgi:uncharacterized RDD family membrane protein YckC